MILQVKWVEQYEYEELPAALPKETCGSVLGSYRSKLSLPGLSLMRNSKNKINITYSQLDGRHASSLSRPTLPRKQLRHPHQHLDISSPVPALHAEAEEGHRRDGTMMSPVSALHARMHTLHAEAEEGDRQHINYSSSANEGNWSRD